MAHFFNSRLSNKLFFAAMGTALLIGLLLSLVQIALDARQARLQLAIEAHQVVAIVQESATQAALQLDHSLAEQVVEGLFRHNSIFYAAISVPGQPPLASAFRNKHEIPYRAVISRVLGLEYSLTEALMTKTSKTAGSTKVRHIGNIEVSLDPSNAANAFIQRCKTTLASGLAQAIVFGFVLYLIFRHLVARPMTSLLTELGEIDPLQPSKRMLSAPKGHEEDELGAWVHKINGLFKAIARFNSRRRLAEAHVERLSNYDMLTELPNRSLLIRRIEQTIQESSERNTLFAVIFCALDDFKSVNLLHSYHTGDQLLLNLTERFRSELHPDYTIARVGGDVFAMIIPNLRNDLEAADVAQRILDTIRNPFWVENHNLSLSATIGITLYPNDGNQAEQLLKNAENVMQLAKSQGGNNYQFYVANIDQKIREAKALEKQLYDAVEKNQLELVFQPQINLVSGEVKGAEALVRWHHPELGLIYPDKFIPLAERTGAIVGIGQWVFIEACNTLKKWHQAGYQHLTMSINVSAVQLHQATLVENIMATLNESRVPPRQIILEITETVVMGNVDLAIRLLNQIKKVGVQLAIDDFGTGYSSLSYLKKLPMDELKIDQAFVHDMLEDSDNGTIVDAIIQLGHSLGLTVVAEGTQSPNQVTYLQKCHCDIAQGYLYSHPISSNKFLKLLKRERRSSPKLQSST